MHERLAMLLTGKVEPQPHPEFDPRIPISRVARFYGVSPRTIDRWLAKPALGFPAPEKINGRRYIRLSRLLAWDEARAEAGADAREAE